MMKTEVVSSCAVAPLPSPGMMGNGGGAQVAGSYHCQAPVMHAGRGKGQKQGCPHLGCFVWALVYQGWADMGVSPFKNRKGQKQIKQGHTEDKGVQARPKMCCSECRAIA